MLVMLVLLAAGLAANVLLGPLEFGGLVWRVSPDGRKQTYGADAAMLPLVVPAARGTALAPIILALTACTIALLRTNARGGQRAGAARPGGGRTRGGRRRYADTRIGAAVAVNAAGRGRSGRARGRAMGPRRAQAAGANADARHVTIATTENGGCR